MNRCNWIPILRQLVNKMKSWASTLDNYCYIKTVVSASAGSDQVLLLCTYTNYIMYHNRLLRSRSLSVPFFDVLINIKPVEKYSKTSMTRTPMTRLPWLIQTRLAQESKDLWTFKGNFLISSWNICCVNSLESRRFIEDIYSFAVNTINIVIECNENISIFTSAKHE